MFQHYIWRRLGPVRACLLVASGRALESFMQIRRELDRNKIPINFAATAIATQYGSDLDILL